MRIIFSWLWSIFLAGVILQMVLTACQLGTILALLNVFSLFCWLTGTLGLAGVSTGFRKLGHDLETARQAVGSIEDFKASVQTLQKLEAASLLSGMVLWVVMMIKLISVQDDPSSIGMAIAHLFLGSLFAIAGARIICFCAELRLRTRIPEGLREKPSNFLGNMLAVAFPIINLFGFSVVMIVLSGLQTTLKGGHP